MQRLARRARAHFWPVLRVAEEAGEFGAAAKHALLLAVASLKAALATGN